MSILISLLSYVAAFWIMGLTSLIVGLFLPRLVIRGIKLLGPVQHFIAEVLVSSVGVYFVALMGRLTPLHASIAMVLIPALMNFLNDRNRIAKAKRGESGALAILRNKGEEHLYDQRLDIWSEYSGYYGHLVGFTTGVFLFLRNEPFF